MQTNYMFDEFRRTYFVIDSFEDLLRITAETDFQPIYERLRHEPLLASDAACCGDTVVSLEALNIVSRS